MLSKGGKIEYFCPYCDDTDIVPRKELGDSFALIIDPWLLKFNSGWCRTCKQGFPWARRIKISLKRGKKDGNR